MLNRRILIVGVLVLSGCAHHKDVRPGGDGIHRILVEAEEQEDASRDALSQAQHYCESIDKKTAAVINEKSTYIGSIDENTRKTVKQVSTAASMVGGVVAGHGFISGDKGARDAGLVTQVGGAAGQAVTGGKNYRFEMTFRCQ